MNFFSKKVDSNFYKAFITPVEYALSNGVLLRMSGSEVKNINRN
jgi:hypothetical protein